MTLVMRGAREGSKKPLRPSSRPSVPPTASPSIGFDTLTHSPPGQKADDHFAFGSLSITPNRLPSVSLQYAKYPTVGMGVLGMTSVPPAFVTALTALSTEPTPRVLVVVVTSPLRSNPPLIPGAPFSPVFTIQYSIGPGHFSIFQPKAFL